MKRKENYWLNFLLDNFRWMIASLLMAFGLWVIAVLRSDPIQQGEFPRRIPIQYLQDETMVITSTLPTEGALVTLRAPRSVWATLREDQIKITADLRGRAAGTQFVELEGRLAEPLRGKIISISPDELEITLEELASRRIPIRTIVTQEPPSGYSYPPPVCSLAEVTARGPAEKLQNAQALGRLNLSEERSPITVTVSLLAVNEDLRAINGVTLDPSQVECRVEIAQREGVSELSVIPKVTGFPPDGYIYEGFEFEPQTVTVTGQQSTIRALNGVVETEPISLTGATSNFERTVSVVLPAGVRLLPESQAITVRVTIGTIPASRQFESVPVQVENLGTGLSVKLLPDTVTVFVVGPQPTVETIKREDLRIVVNLSGLGVGTYQKMVAASLNVADLNTNTQVTVQPNDISVTISELDAEPTHTVVPEPEVR